MSIGALTVLKEMGLLDKRDQAVDVSSMDSQILQSHLDYYKKDRNRRAEKDADETIGDGGDLAALISSSSYRNTVASLLPSCFVHTRVYADDPLYKLAYQPNSSADVVNSYLGMNQRSGPTAAEVGKALQYFSELAPLIRCGSLTLLPLSQIHEPAKNTPIYYSEDRFRSGVPSHLHDFIHQSAIVQDISPVSGGGAMIIHDEISSKPGRGIAIQFEKDYPKYSGKLFFYMDVEFKDVDKETGRCSIHQSLDWDNPPSKEVYEAWVYQSINRSIIDRLEGMSCELGVAAQLQASYHTESEFESQICAMPGASDSSDDNAIAVNFLNANAPYLSLSSPGQLARFRQDFPQLFDRWQQSLLAVTSELTGYNGDFNTRANQLFNKEIKPQLKELEGGLRKARNSVIGATLITTSTMGMALLTSSELPFATILALGSLSVAGASLPNVSDFIQKRKTPAFVWNKLLKQ